MIKKSLSAILALAMIVCMLPTAFAETTHNCGNTDDCIVCYVAESINNLPNAEDITVDNAAEVTDAIHAIDRVKFDLEWEQYEELLTMVETTEDASGNGALVPARYMTAVEKITSLGGIPLVITKKFSTTDGNTLNYDNAKVQFEITNVDTDAAQTVTMSYMDVMPNTLSDNADFYSADNDGFSFTYILPVGTYRICEVGEDDVTLNSVETVATTVTYNGDESADGIEVDLASAATCLVGNYYDPVEPSFQTTADAGFYAESSKASKREGVVAFTTCITNMNSLPYVVESFGYTIEVGDTTLTYESNDSEALSEEGGYFNIIINNIPKAQFDTEFSATPYLHSSRNEDFIGNTVTTSVSAINKWLGEK